MQSHCSNYYIPTHLNCVITENNVDTPITITCDLLINFFISNNITVWFCFKVKKSVSFRSRIRRKARNFAKFRRQVFALLLHITVTTSFISIFLCFRCFFTFLHRVKWHHTVLHKEVLRYNCIYMISWILHTIWLFLTYDLLEDRCFDNITVNITMENKKILWFCGSVK